MKLVSTQQNSWRFLDKEIDILVTELDKYNQEEDDFTISPALSIKVWRTSKLKWIYF